MANARAMLLGALIGLVAQPAFAQGDACAIETGSFAVVTRDAPKRSSIVSVVPQTPCPTLNAGSSDALGQISVDVTVGRHRPRDSERE